MGQGGEYRCVGECVSMNVGARSVDVCKCACKKRASFMEGLACLPLGPVTCELGSHSWGFLPCDRTHRESNTGGGLVMSKGLTTSVSLQSPGSRGFSLWPKPSPLSPWVMLLGPLTGFSPQTGFVRHAAL